MKLKFINIATGSQLFKALSEEPRLRILHLIRNNNAMCISDLEQILDYTQAKTSRHLTYLKNAGLLKISKHDQWVYYHLMEDFAGMVETVLSWFEKDPVLVQDQESFNTMYANNHLALRKLHNKQGKYRLRDL